MSVCWRKLRRTVRFAFWHQLAKLNKMAPKGSTMAQEEETTELVNVSVGNFGNTFEIVEGDVVWMFGVAAGCFYGSVHLTADSVLLPEGLESALPMRWGCETKLALLYTDINFMHETIVWMKNLSRWPYGVVVRRCFHCWSHTHSNVWDERCKTKVSRFRWVCDVVVRQVRLLDTNTMESIRR